MKKILKICLIVVTCLVILGGAWIALTWFKVIPNWFGIKISCNRYDMKGYNYDKVRECRSKCESVEGYDVQSLRSRFELKSLEMRYYCQEYYCRPNEYCPSVREDDVVCYAGPHYTTWLNDVFTSDEIEKINEYKSCSKSCGYQGYKNYNKRCANR